MIAVKNELKAYEHNDKDVSVLSPAVALAIVSHGIHSDRVVLITPGGDRFTLIAKDLKAAIDNATNTARF